MLLLLLLIPMSADDPASDLRKMAGTWVATSWFSEGQEHQPEGRIRLEVKGDIFRWLHGESSYETKVTKLDPSQGPKLIDLTRGHDNQTIVGIYKLEGDTLTICTFRGSDDDNRPNEFSADPGSRRLLRVFKREASKE